eukprot:101083-Hanusia_phi.AAC.1
MRLAHNYLDKGHVVYGDSAFASVSTAITLLSRKTFFTGLVKQCHSGFPKRYLNQEAWDVMDPGPSRQDTDSFTECRDRWSEFHHLWRECTKENPPRLVSTWNTTQEATPRVRIISQTGQTEKYTFTVPRTEMIKSYFTAASVIDVHNHLRQD